MLGAGNDVAHPPANQMPCGAAASSDNGDDSGESSDGTAFFHSDPIVTRLADTVMSILTDESPASSHSWHLFDVALREQFHFGPMAHTNALRVPFM
jgi:hypothetical protein